MHNPIVTLRDLVREAARASTAEKRARAIVARVRQAMDVAVCSLYAVNERGTLVLVATEGLTPESVGRIRLKQGQGLVGLIADTQHLLNLESASSHPFFHFFPGSGEEGLEAFLGAPVVHKGKIAGVLVVEEKERRKFSEEEESFLVTAAAHIGLFDPADLQPADPGEEVEEQEATTRRYYGISVCPGIGIGRVVFIHEEGELLKVTDTETGDPDGEIAQFREAVEKTLQDLDGAREQLGSNLAGDVAEVFTVYELLLKGDEFCGAVEAAIGGNLSAATALRNVVLEYVGRFDAMGDDYFRARKEDIQILGDRIYGHLIKASGKELPEDEVAVIAGRLISIADIAKYPVEKLAGIVSGEGSVLSHTALLAKALRLPAVMGLDHYSDLRDGELVIVDGYRGTTVASPSDAVCEEYRRLMREDRVFSDDLARLKDEPAVTTDGVRVRLLANTGLLADISPGISHGAEGIGLYRSEIPFITRESFPSEEEQVEIYRRVLEAYRGFPVYMRTLDIGGDKPLPYFPFEEENPALGWRGIRFTMDNSMVLITQVRAMLRASLDIENLGIMLPMISRVSEVSSFSGLLENVISQLWSEGFEVVRPKVGIMAEVPVVLSVMPSISGLIDFISVGTNDLSQYLLAVDRNNTRVAGLFEQMHPGVIQNVSAIVDCARELDLEVSVCGDLASDPAGAVLLLAMGVDSLSVPAPMIPRIKWVIRSLSMTRARQALDAVRAHSDSQTVLAEVQEMIREIGLGRLVDEQRQDMPS